MAFDLFLKIDGIEGESTDARHAKEIEVLSFSWGETQAGAPAAGGAGAAGKVVMQPAVFAVQYSKASPKLFQACAAGTRIKSAVLNASRVGETPQDYLTWTFTDVLVSSYQTSASAQGSEPTPIDQFSLTFAQIQVSYKQPNPDGTLGSPIAAGWNLKENKPA